MTENPDLAFWGDFIARLDEAIERLSPDRIRKLGLEVPDNHDKTLAFYRGLKATASKIRDQLRSGVPVDQLPTELLDFVNQHRGKDSQDGV